MTLREFFEKIKNKDTLVDLCTPRWRRIQTVERFERELNSIMLDSKISNWSYSNSDMFEVVM